MKEHQRGTFELGAPTDDVREGTGTDPEDFETIARRYAALPEARRSAWNTLKAGWDFLRIGVMPAYDLDAFERRQQHPLVDRPRLAIDAPEWRREHRVASVSDAQSASERVLAGSACTMADSSGPTHGQLPGSPASVT